MLKSQWCDGNKHKAAVSSMVAHFLQKSYNTEMLQQFFTNLFLEFLLFSSLVLNHTRAACKHWQRWARRTSFSPLRKRRTCHAGPQPTSLASLFFGRGKGGWPKLEKPEKPKWESLLCSASFNEFGGDGEESGCGHFPIFCTQNIRLT